MSEDQTIITGSKPSVKNTQEFADIHIAGFTIKRFIARGGMASVYLARQETLGRDVALKVMDKNDDETFIERFLNEGRLVASMSHPNVITIYDLGVLDDGRAYLSMEYIDGGDLEQRLRRPLSESQAIRMLEDLARCLSYVHKHHVIHRDIKPANILFRLDGTMVLTDFGIARQSTQDVALTRDGMAVGSPGYMSPEQAQAQKVDHRTDIYSLGVIFTEMLLGENKFADDSYIQTSMNHIQMDIPQLPLPICQYQILVEKLLAKNVEKRFEHAEALIRFIKQLPEAEDRLLPVDEASVEQEQASIQSMELEALAPDKSNSLYSSQGSWLTLAIFAFILTGVAWWFRLDIVPFEYLPEKDQAAKLVMQGNDALKANRLLVPESRSAFYFYKQALELDAKNLAAQEGFSQIADRYARLAAQAAKSKQRSKLKKYVERGLSVQADHQQLNALKRQHKL